VRQASEQAAVPLHRDKRIGVKCVRNAAEIHLPAIGQQPTQQIGLSVDQGTEAHRPNRGLRLELSVGELEDRRELLEWQASATRDVVAMEPHCPGIAIGIERPPEIEQQDLLVHWLLDESAGLGTHF